MSYLIGSNLFKMFVGSFFFFFSTPSVLSFISKVETGYEQGLSNAYRK